MLEAQRIGVDGLVLDFCRQPPILLYHDALVGPHAEWYRSDPRQTDSGDPAGYARWFRYRADVLTGFLRALRARVRTQEHHVGRPCPILVRIPDNAEWLLLAYGLDVDRWLADDLVDGTMLSPFPLAVEDSGQYPEQHVAAAHRHGKICIGGIGSLGLMRIEDDLPLERYFHPKPVYALAARLYHAGVDGLSIYQSESLVSRRHLQQVLYEIGDAHVVAQRANELPEPPTDFPVGLDWHSRFDRTWPGLAHRQPHGLRVAVAGGGAL